MRYLIALAAPVLITGCGSPQPPSPQTSTGQCSAPGSHEATLTSACIDGIGQQIAGQPDKFFIVRFDNAANLYVQGALTQSGGLVVEVPGPKFADIGENARLQLAEQGFVIDEQIGNYLFPLPAAFEDGRFAELVISVGEYLGYAEDSPISYEVAELALPGQL